MAVERFSGKRVEMARKTGGMMARVRGFCNVLVAGAILLFALASCASMEKAHQASDVKEAERYIIGPEDVLEISVWKNADLSKVVAVRPDGRITLPLIGDMQAAGVTSDKLKDDITARLKQYQDAAVVSVIVQQVNSYRIYMLGEVRNPGSYQVKTRTTLLQAVSLAGGFTQYASKDKIVLLHVNESGVEEKTTVRLKDIVYSEKGGKNIILKPGDTVFVP